MDDITLKEIRSAGELYTIKEEWLQLYKMCPDAAPFQNPQWILTWWKYYGSGELCSFALRKRGVLICLAPLFIYNDNIQNKRILLFIGNGVSDYLDITAHPGIYPVAAAYFYRYITEIREKWDELDLKNIPYTSPLLSFMPKGEELFRLTESDVYPVSMLPPDIDEFTSLIPVNLRKNTQRAIRQMNKVGDVILEVQNEQNRKQILNELFALNTHNWEEKNERGVLADDYLQKFHLEAARAMDDQQMLSLFRLRISGRTAAVIYCMKRSSRLYYYIGGYDPALKKYSPGSAAIFLIMKEAIKNGFSEFDFLRGSELYKYHWGAVDRKGYKIILNAQSNENLD